MWPRVEGGHSGKSKGGRGSQEPNGARVSWPAKAGGATRWGLELTLALGIESAGMASLDRLLTEKALNVDCIMPSACLLSQARTDVRAPIHDTTPRTGHPVAGRFDSFAPNALTTASRRIRTCGLGSLPGQRLSRSKNSKWASRKLWWSRRNTLPEHATSPNRSHLTFALGMTSRIVLSSPTPIQETEGLARMVCIASSSPTHIRGTPRLQGTACKQNGLSQHGSRSPR